MLVLRNGWEYTLYPGEPIAMLSNNATARVGEYEIEYEARSDSTGTSVRATRKVIVGKTYLARKHGNSLEF